MPDHISLIKPLDMIGRSFIMYTSDGKKKLSTHIVEAIQDHSNKFKDRPERIKFRYSVNDDQYEKICHITIFYNTLKMIQRLYGSSNVSLPINTYWGECILTKMDPNTM